MRPVAALSSLLHSHAAEVASPGDQMITVCRSTHTLVLRQSPATRSSTKVSRHGDSPVFSTACLQLNPPLSCLGWG